MSRAIGRMTSRTFSWTRTAPHIDRVVATTDLGVEIVLPLSEVIGQFGLRFAAAVLPPMDTVRGSFVPNRRAR